MSDVSDDELEALTARIRDVRRRQRNAKLAGVGVAFLGLVIGLALQVLLQMRLFWTCAIAGAAAGAFVYKKLEPNEDVADIE